MLAKKFRISRQKDFDYIFKNGKTFRGHFIIAKTVPGVNNISRFAVVVSKKVSANATVRNMAKRRIRASIFKLLPRLEQPVNTVIVVKKFDKNDKINLQQDLENVLVEAKVFKKNV